MNKNSTLEMMVDEHDEYEPKLKWTILLALTTVKCEYKVSS